ncbi:high-temperature-induced dauer-formation protein-domain-containing protein [Parasitella parasitica]|nr:high-temperature-induced dauer-formation protein-domain-containing protein [Parasitella parasitica]
MGAADSKLAFRRSVFRLYEEPTIPASENEYWEQFWNLPESADDIFSLIGANDIRRTRDMARKNFETLIDKALEKMQQILKASNFPSEQYSINHLLNCCRILTRLIPFVFESADCLEWEDLFFWTPRQVEKEKKNPDDKPEYDTLVCRGELVLDSTIQALFLAGFTIPISLATKVSKVNYAIWENGVGSTIPISTYKDNEANRTEVLRLLAVLLSKSMYVPPAQLLSKEDHWLRYVAVKLERKVVLVILCSLVNTICNYDPTGWVPYNHVVQGGPREQLVSFCLTNLLILLDYRSPQQAELLRQYDQAVSPTSATTDLPASMEILTLDNPDAITKTSVELEVFTPVDQLANQHEENAFRHYMSKLHRDQDFKFLMDGIYRLLSNPMTAVSTYLPGSTKRVGCFVNVMMMCWKLLETNSRFANYLVETDRALDLTVLLIFHATDNKDKIAQLGLVRMCAFILQTLSSNKEYSAKLNKSFSAHSSLPSSIRLYAFNGTYADFLIISVFSLIASTQGKLSSLYPALILTISNISPYLTNLGVTTASKLLTLFNSMSSPSFLMADEYNFQLTGYLLETFSNIINYQYAENPNLIYSMVLHHDYFEKLDQLTFEDAVRESERVRQLRTSKEVERTEKNADATSPPPTPPATTEDSHDSTENEQSSLAEHKTKDIPKGKDNEESKPSYASVAASANNHDQEEEENKINKPEQIQVVPTGEDGAISNTNTRPCLNGFIPIEAWWSYWKSHMQLATTLAMLKHLVPKVEEKCAEGNIITLEELMVFLKTIQLDNVLPEDSKSIFIRKFQWGEALVIWFRSMMWGQNYVFSMNEHGAWNGTHVKLFQIKEE